MHFKAVTRGENLAGRGNFQLQTCGAVHVSGCTPLSDSCREGAHKHENKFDDFGRSHRYENFGFGWPQYDEKIGDDGRTIKRYY